MRSFSLASLLVLATPAVASAHITLTSPAPRSAPALQKEPPCGAAGSVRSANPTVFEPGATITVTWNETIDHTGHYRISLDESGEDFTIPLSFNDTTQSENVVEDLIADRAGGGLYSQVITLPTTPCENCTIQLIQMMTDASYDPVTDIYFTCADIAIREGGVPGPDAGVDPADPDAGNAGEDDDDGTPSTATGGCSTTPDAGGGAGILSLLLAVVVMRRRRRS